MFIIDCPHCGPRDALEFSYGEDASAQAPALDAGSEQWFEFIYQRTNPRGNHWEYWQHIAGCRRWLRVQRDTVSHVVNSVEDAGGLTRAAGNDE